MCQFTELLPPTRTEPHAAIDWTPTGPGAGVLLIKQRRAYVEYVVTELETKWEGRAFKLAKRGPGTDPTENAYCCFVSADARNRLCECKGWYFGADCKHLAAVVTLLDNGQL